MSTKRPDALPCRYERSSLECPAQSPHSAPAREAVKTLLRAGHQEFFCAQNILEFWNVATRPVDKNGLGLLIEEALQQITMIERSLTLLPDGPGIYPQWKTIVGDHRVLGTKIYDARLVAVMDVHTVGTLLTFNDADFKRFRHISVVHPSVFAG